MYQKLWHNCCKKFCKTFLKICRKLFSFQGWTGRYKLYCLEVRSQGTMQCNAMQLNPFLPSRQCFSIFCFCHKKVNYAYLLGLCEEYHCWSAYLARRTLKWASREYSVALFYKFLPVRFLLEETLMRMRTIIVGIESYCFQIPLENFSI